MSPQQLEFSDRPAPAQAHSATSQEAAASIEPMAGTLRGIVLAYVRQTGTAGATDEEMQTALDMNPSTQRPRRVELVRGNLIYDSGAMRLTRANRKAAVWRAR